MTTGTAQATATAQTANGQQATASATASGSSATGSTSATALYAGAVTSVLATTSTAGGGTLTGQSGANIAGTFPGLLTSQYRAYAYASGLPYAPAVNGVISGNTTIAAQLGGGNVNAVILGFGTLGGYGEPAATGTQTLTGSETFTLNATGLSGNLILGLASPQFATGFSSFSITATSTSAFGNQIVLGATGGNGPPVVAAPASVTTLAGRPTTLGGVALSETGTTANESFSVVLSDTNGKLSAAGALGAGVIGAGAGTLTVYGNIVQVNAALATLSNTDSVAAPDTIAIQATDSLGNASAGSIAVTVASAPVITAPAAALIGLNRPGGIAGIAWRKPTPRPMRCSA